MGDDGACARERAERRATPAERAWVIKLGGSLTRSGPLAEWLHEMASSRLPLVVVPGGGPFADQVRAAQELWRIDDRAAHAMALLAMEQCGRLMQALEPRLAPCAGLEDLHRTLNAGRAAIWLPQALALEDAEIEESWDVTSDSLAAWLAGKLRARGLILVKSAELPAGDASAEDLSRIGLVDPAFGRYLGRAGIDAWCVHAGTCAATMRSLAVGRVAGTAIVGDRAAPA